ncbi:MAG: acyl-CoA thioesterase [Bacteroidia bacterium]|nr:acyl-CoA thioesterase [Bacteroidia bacterium]
MPESRLIRIRGFHCDAYGHVNNARYLELLEEARWEALVKNDVLKHFEALGLQFFIVNVNISFKKPVVPNDLADVQTSVKEFGRMSITFLQEIYVDNALTTQADVTFVLFDTKASKPTSLTPEIRDIFNSFENGQNKD